MPNPRSILNCSFCMGFLTPNEARVAESYVVAWDERNSQFYMAPKANVKLSRIARVIVSRVVYALELCSDNLSCSQKSCTKLHITEAPTPIDVDSASDSSILACLKNGTSIRLRPCDLQRTAGLCFVSTLKSAGHVKECYPWVCQRFLNGNCVHGSKCLYVHVDPQLVQSIPRPTIAAVTSLAVALEQSLPTHPGLNRFIESAGDKFRLQTVGDLMPLSEAVFGAIMNRDIDAHPDHRAFWLLLQQVRNISRTAPLADALSLFPGVDAHCKQWVHSHLAAATVNDLCAIKPKAFYAAPFPLQVLDACEKLRARFEEDTEVYSSVNLAELPAKAFFRKVANLVCEFREKHAHKSWRKQDATRPIVTSAITYVDPDECHCRFDPAANGVTSKSPAVRPTRTMNTIENVPTQQHWCQCTRKTVLAVNYELSTPSGSRCSEQNAMGVIASMGLPTTCIRELFVHGGAHNGEDPNPLFPCGVCENMFRRVAKDVQKAYGGDVTLYMFDQETTPRKLVAIPILEVSHREGSSFRKFVAEDLRHEDTGVPGNGRMTPLASMVLEAEGDSSPSSP